jgi:hypothetical protein
MVSEAAALLEKYLPLLVILPQDTSRHRPWSRWYRPYSGPRGDYHPCSAEFFLSFVLRRDEARPWMEDVFKDTTQGQPLGLALLRELTLSIPAERTENWEIDLAAIPSQRPEEAWTAYRAMLPVFDELGGAVTYGRAVRYPNKTCLQYWFCYAYNDAPNKHEGDWEMVTIELDAGGAPVRAGYAGHASGFRRDWRQVRSIEGRPLVFVARGSHAAYFEHKPRGHRGNSLPSSKGFPLVLDLAWARFARFFQNLVYFLRINDRTAADPDDASDPTNRGQILRPALKVFPPADQEGQGDFWWMRLRCRWGSRHSRLFGTIAPVPAWCCGQKWDDPASWIDELPEG